MKFIVISIDGNIGSGKSYLLGKIMDMIPNVHVVLEPVDKWTSLIDQKSGKNMLELFYDDKLRWSYTFQTCALSTRYKSMQDTIANLQQDTEKDTEKVHVIFIERSIFTDRYVFAEMLYQSGQFSSIEWELYQSLFEMIRTKYKVHGAIYLTTSVTTSKSRIDVRGRHEETSISTDYLDALDKQHVAWFSTMENWEDPSIPMMKISTEQDNSIDTIIASITNFITTVKEYYTKK
jgi:deoxycitidine kinase